MDTQRALGWHSRTWALEALYLAESLGDRQIVPANCWEAKPQLQSKEGRNQTSATNVSAWYVYDGFQ